MIPGALCQKNNLRREGTYRATMPHASSQALTDHLQTLFVAGTCVGLSDADLIERFTTSKGEGSERRLSRPWSHGTARWCSVCAGTC